MQQPAALAAFLKVHQGALIGADMEGDVQANPALEHIVENLDLGHGHNGGGPDPKAAPRKGWPGPGAVASQGETVPAVARNASGPVNTRKKRHDDSRKRAIKEQQERERQHKQRLAKWGKQCNWF
jgi:hypothetical protein